MRRLPIVLLVALACAVPWAAGELDVADGVVVKFGDAGQLIVRDGLVVNGEVVFTSDNDDTIAGAVYPTANTPGAGDWMGILLERSAPLSLTQLTGLRVRYAGNGVPAFRLRSTSIALDGFAIEDSAGVGLDAIGSTSSSLSQLVLTGNAIGFRADAGSTVSLSGALISGNTTFGAQNLDPLNPLAISTTWWGHPSGPLDGSDDTGTGGLFNPNGLGNAVTDGILYDPASQLIPVIGASIEPLDGNLALQQDVTFRLRSLTAVAAKLDEDNTFPSSAFKPLAPTHVLTLSPGDGLKTVYARFQAATGNTQDVSTQLTLDVSPPMVTVTNPNVGDVVGRPITVSAQVTDVTGIERVDFLVNDVLAFSDTTNDYSFDWDVRPLADGPYEISAVGVDTAGNAQRVDVAVTVSVMPPAAPIVTSPTDGMNLATDTIAVTGTAEPLASVAVFANVILVGQVMADGAGDWSIAGVVLAEGNSTITATASDSSGTSQPSAPIQVTIDTGPPGPPLFLFSSDLPGGAKRFDWVESIDFDVVSYNLYRAAAPFTMTAGATQIQTSIVRLDTEDTPPSDGTFYYGVTSVDAVGNEGPLSNVVEVMADTTAPTAAVSFSPVSPVGPGPVLATLILSEEASQEPFLSVKPSGGAPAVIDLVAGGDVFTWTGTLDVTASMPTGTAAVTFSARDLSQNLGSVLTAGSTLDLDTRGPQGSIVITPMQAEYGPGAYTADLTLDEPPVAAPVLRFVPPLGAPVVLAPTGAGTAWQAALTIDPAQGDGVAGFELDATDSFGNVTSGAIPGADIQLDVTPPVAPGGLSATPLPAGAISVEWGAVGDATSYNLRRAVQGTGINLGDAPLVSGLATVVQVDLPGADGAFEYAATAVDASGNESALSNLGSATSDRMPPGDPSGLSLAIENDGIRADWTPDGGVPADTFSLYRSTSAIATLTGLQPVQVGLIPPTAFDQPPADGDYFYAVVGLDAVGNASNFDTAGPLTFDQAAPVISISGVTAGQITNAAVTIDFSAADLNLNAVTGTLDGQPFTSGSTEAAEGPHTLVVDADDTSGNASSTTLMFVIDLTPPLITISGVTDGQTANAPVTPVVTIVEDNPGTSTITLNAAPFVSGTTVADDGAYTLIADATDAAGNAANMQVGFTLDGPPQAVGNLELLIQDGLVPQISWTAPVAGDVVGYDVSRDGVLLTNPPITLTSFQDANFDPFATQVYEIVARDAIGQAGPPSAVTFTPITLTLGDTGLNGVLTRHYLDTIAVNIGNANDATLSNVRLDMTLMDGAQILGTHTVEPGFNVVPGGSVKLDDVFSSGAGSADFRTLDLDLSIKPGGGATMRYLKTEVLPVREPPPPIEIFTNPVVLGAAASFRLRILNHGSADIQLRTAEDGGPTNDVEVVVSDLDGNILGSNTLEQFDGGVFNLTDVSIADLPSGGSFFTSGIDVPIPSNAPAQIVVEAFVHETHYDLFGFVPDVVGPELSILDLVGTGDPPYLAEATTDKQLYDQGETVVLSGRAFDPGTMASVPDVEVKVGIHTRGFDRFLSVMTDGNGDFVAFFEPIPGEAGNYTAWATHPIVVERGSQAQFEIVGLRLNPRDVNLLMSKAATFPLGVTLKNVGESVQSGLSVSFLSGNGVSGAVDPAEIPASLGPGKKVQLTVDITTEPVADDANFLFVTIDSANGASVTLEVSLELLDPFPAISTKPSFVELGLGNEDLVTRTVRIENRGFQALENVVLELPATPWITLGVGPDLPPIPAGGFADIPVIVAPDANVSPGIYSDRFVINSTNHPPYIENIFATVTSSQTGRAAFEVRNTEDVLLPGASVWIQSLDVPSLILEQNTDALGQTSFEDLPAGKYQYRVQATGTQPSVNNFVVQPDQTTAIAVFNLVVYVTLDWTVTPVIIADEYNFKLEATFETFVPAPVLITDPLDFTIELQPGDTYYGEYKLKNLGLIAVDDVVISTAAGGNMVLDTLVDSIDRLGAKKEVTIPFRLTRPLSNAAGAPGAPGSRANTRADTPNIADLCAPLPARIQQIGGYTCRAGFEVFTSAYVRMTIRIPKITVVAPGQKSLLDELKLCDNKCSLCGIIGSCAGAFGGNKAKAVGASCKCFDSFTKIKDLGTAASTACDCVSSVVAELKSIDPMFDDSGVSNVCGCLQGFVTGAQSDPLACLGQGGPDLAELADIAGKLKNAFRCGREIGDCVCWLIPELCQLPSFTFSTGTSGGQDPVGPGSGGSTRTGTPRLTTGDYAVSFPSILQFLDCDDFPSGSQ